MQNVWFAAAAWMGLAFVASIVSIRIGISVALLEIAAGVIAGNFLGFHTTEWINFLATFGAGLLTRGLDERHQLNVPPALLQRHVHPLL